MMLFALDASLGLGSRIAEELGCPLSPHEEREFSRGEHKSRPLVSVWNDDVYVLSSLHGDSKLSVNDKICRLLFFVGALKDAGAGRVTAVMPYVAYSRKDRRTKPQDPVTTRYLAAALSSVGTDRVITINIHNPAAYENSFRCPSVNLTALDLFADYFYRSDGNDVDTIVSPDIGGLKATRLFVDAYVERSHQAVKIAVMDKQRSEGRIFGSGLIGDVGRNVLILDDMIGSGTTLCRATAACMDAGASRISVGATHGLFEGGAPALFHQPGIDDIVVSDTVAIEKLGLSNEQRERIRVLGTAELFAKCIRSMRG